MLACLALLVLAPLDAADNRALDAIDDAVRAAIERKELPGAVVLVLHQDKIVYRKALGQRSLTPAADRA